MAISTPGYPGKAGRWCSRSGGDGADSSSRIDGFTVPGCAIPSRAVIPERVGLLDAVAGMPPPREGMCSAIRATLPFRGGLSAVGHGEVLRVPLDAADGDDVDVDGLDGGGCGQDDFLFQTERKLALRARARFFFLFLRENKNLFLSFYNVWAVLM